MLKRHTSPSFGGGGVSDSSPVTIGTYWMDVQPVSQHEKQYYMSLQQVVTHKIKCRAGISVQQGDVLTHDSRDLYVESVSNPDEQDRFLRVVAREGKTL